MDRAFLVMGPSTARSDFERLAKDAGFSVSQWNLTPLSAGVTNAAECLQLVFSKEGAVIFSALASVIVAYFSFKKSRRVTITLFANGRIKALDARGFSEAELAKILPEVRDVLVYDEPEK